MTDTTLDAAPARKPEKLGPGVAARMDTGNIVLRRWAGCWIDFLVLGLIFWLFVLLGAALNSPPAADAALVVGGLAMLAYFPVTEGVWGRSAGKFVTGTIVVDANGRPPGFGRAIVRTLLRVVEVNPFLFGGVPAGLVAINTPRVQRIGDLVAGTYVVPLGALKRARAAPPVADVFD